MVIEHQPHGSDALVQITFSRMDLSRVLPVSARSCCGKDAWSHERAKIRISTTSSSQHYLFRSVNAQVYRTLTHYSGIALFQQSPRHVAAYPCKMRPDVFRLCKRAASPCDPMVIKWEFQYVCLISHWDASNAISSTLNDPSYSSRQYCTDSVRVSSCNLSATSSRSRRAGS
jgi:hypothetical protein